ncbi:Transposable element Hobo transposase [Frankliniella fusca]|uniref:Transposable element Hobo transposase n=1 Tax=Frankliniella fusca TaxID=407009 RepID=A0AAE1GRX5_9NEOP|nr:Transposable element Hobo transposase [Frankliniella fusca]
MSSKRSLSSDEDDDLFSSPFKLSLKGLEASMNDCALWVSYLEEAQQFQDGSTSRVVFISTETVKEKYSGYLYCVSCKQVKSYVSSKGTSGLSRHPCVKKAEAARLAAPPEDTPLPPLNQIVPGKVKSEVLKMSTLYCATDLASFQSVEGEGFLNLAQSFVDIGATHGRLDVRRMVPHRTTVTDKLEEIAGDIKLKFVPRAREAIAAGRCAATTDMWTQENKKVHFLAVILHILNSEDKLERRTAFTIDFGDEAASAENIRAQIMFQFQLLGIGEEEVEKIVFVTDRGANIVSALKNFSRLDCISHVINTVLKTGLGLKRYEITMLTPEASDIVGSVRELLTHLNARLPMKSKFPISKKQRPHCVTPPVYLPMLTAFRKRLTEITQRLKLRSEEFLLAGIDIDRVDDLIQTLRPVEKLMCRHHGPDVAGSLWPEIKVATALGVNDSPLAQDLKCQWQTEFFPLRYAYIHSQCKALVTYVKSSSLNTQLKSTLKQEMEVRWNTSLTMFESIYKVYDEASIINLLIMYRQLCVALAARDESARLKNVQKDTLKQFLDLLTPFKVESVKLQAEKTPTLQHVVLSRAALADHCQQPSQGQDQLITVLKERIHLQLERVYKCEMRHKMANFLWPSSRKLRMMTNEERSEVHTEIKKILVEMEDHEAEAAAPPPPKRPRPAEVYRKYLEDAEDSEEIVEDEIDRYVREPIGDDSDILGWWKQKRERFPRLSRLAQQFLVIPASSASAEREFSEAGHVFRQKRLRLHPSTASDILFVNSNADLIN